MAQQATTTVFPWLSGTAAILMALPFARTEEPTKPAPAAGLPHGASGLGGAGGVYFLASPGDLTVVVEKQDRNRSARTTELRAILFGPDRRVLGEVTIPDDGKPRGGGLGPLGRATLAARVARKGIYGLNITISQDRYGDEILWGFRTNCPTYVIETSRGHRDERRQEPIVLFAPDRPGDVCFLPRPSAFRIDVSDLPKQTDRLELWDAEGKAIERLRVDPPGQCSYLVPSAPSRDRLPWRLHLPSQQATIQIDGVTRWESGDEFSGLPCWTPTPAAFFKFPHYRWLLTPYSQTVYGRSGEKKEAAFRVHNNSGRAVTVRLSIEFPAANWSAQLSTEQVTLEPRSGADAAVRFTIPSGGAEHVCHVRAIPVEDPDVSTYSTLTVRSGSAPAAAPVKTPIVLRPYEHENVQFGYAPDYPLESQVYFDRLNGPWIRTAGGLATCRAGQWETIEFGKAVQSRTPSLDGDSFPPASSKVAFDSDGDIYVLAHARPQGSMLLHSSDQGKTFSAYGLPAAARRSSAFDIEQFSGHNTPDGPPPIVRFTQTAADPQRIWRRINDLELIVPEKSAGRLVIPPPVLISSQCIGLSDHSGIPSSVVSRGSKVHVVWAEATDPKDRVPGVPTFVNTYDRRHKMLGKPALVGYGAPANDVHNTPSITMDSKGYLHVLAGTHGQPFPYTRSLQPNDSQSGWTEAVPAGKDLKQTYIGLVCDREDTLHLVYRLWQSGVDPFPLSQYAVLAHQRKRAGQPWEPPQPLVVPPFSEYSVYYHRLTIDRQGRLFVSYDYWSTYWFYRTDHRGNRRAVLMSPDAGRTWKLAETRDLCGG